MQEASNAVPSAVSEDAWSAQLTKLKEFFDEKKNLKKNDVDDASTSKLTKLRKWFNKTFKKQ